MTLLKCSSMCIIYQHFVAVSLINNSYKKMKKLYLHIEKQYICINLYYSEVVFFLLF